MASQEGAKKSAVPKLPLAANRPVEEHAPAHAPELLSVHIVDTQILLDKDLRPFAVR